MADQDYPNLYADMEASAQRVRSAAIAYERTLGGSETDMVPVNGYPDQPTIAGRVKLRLDELTEAIDAAIESAKRFVGSSATAPTTRSDGTPLQPGDSYFNTATGFENTWNGTAWYVPNADGQAIQAMLAALTGATKVGKAGGGTVQDSITATESNLAILNAGAARERHMDDFPSSPASTWIARAIAGTRASGASKLKFGAGPYIATGTYACDGLTLEGRGRPVANSGRTAMTGGTIIQGTFRPIGSNLVVTNLGVDCGLPVCNALNGGEAMDGFVCSKTGASMVNVKIHNVSALCRDPLASVHGILLENIDGVDFNELHGYQGFVGVVIKCQNGHADNLYGYKNRDSGVQIKSNSYAVCTRLSLGNVTAYDEGLNLAGSIGVMFYAQDAPLSRIKGGNIMVRGFETSCNMTMLSGTVINDVNIDSINGEAPLGNAFTTYGGIIQCRVGSIQANDSVSGRSVHIHDDCLGIAIGTIQTSSPTGSNLPDAVYLGGIFDVGQIVNTQAYGSAAPPGITVVPNATLRRRWSIGSYSGRLNINTINSGFANGWTQAFADAVSTRYSNGKVIVSGRLAPPPTPATWAGKEVALYFSAAVAPTLARTFSVQGYDSATSKLFPMIMEVRTDGSFAFINLATPAQVPASLAWVILNGVEWDLQLQ